MLAGAIGYVWYQQQQQQQQQAQPGSSAQLQALQQQVQGLDRQVSGLQRQVPMIPEVKALAGRVAALEQQKAPDLSQIESRLSTLEQRQPADLGQLQGQVKALEQQVAGIAQLSQRLDSLAQQVQIGRRPEPAGRFGAEAAAGRG